MIAARRPTLADNAEVERLVRGFAARVLFLRAAFHRGDAGADQPLQAIEAAARELSADLALTLRQRSVFMVLIPEECKTFGDPGTALGMFLAAQLVQGAQDMEDGQMDKHGVHRSLEAVITSVLDRLAY